MPAELSAQDVLTLGRVVTVLRAGGAATRNEVELATGFGRRLVADRLQDGLDLGVIQEGGVAESTGGRSPMTYQVHPRAGVILTAVFGSSEVRLAVTGLDGGLLEHEHRLIDIQNDPLDLLRDANEILTAMRRRVASRVEVWGIVVGLPGAVDFANGTVIQIPPTVKWDGFDVRSWFRRHYDAPVWVDNDVNLMAYGEAMTDPTRGTSDLLFIKVGTGVGSGYLTGGRILRGSSGAAGDIGHIRITDDPRAVCRCGKVGCLEALTGGWAVLQQLEELGRDGSSGFIAERLKREGHLELSDISAALDAGDAATEQLLRRSAETLGGVAADIVNFANPAILVLGGGVVRTGDLTFDVFAETVRSRAVPLAVDDLQIRTPRLEFREGPVGAALLAADLLFAPATMWVWLANGSPAGVSAAVQAATANDFTPHASPIA